MDQLIWWGALAASVLFVGSLALFSNGLGRLPSDDDPDDEVLPNSSSNSEFEPYEHLDQDWETRRD